MATSNYLSATNKSHLTVFKGNSDTLSEASGSGTSASVTSAEDLQKLAIILGLNSVEDVYQERFRVDRRRLEAMLADNLDESQTANAFFNRLMNETNTLINWPVRLKIGARSKKDPHVRVAGRQEDVKMAREKIMQLLDTRSNRVTMKIDVSYTDHSHIIGKAGMTIKRVMEETGCHIHFPDANRTNTLEKSNQVSIAGDVERVERARARVRALTPLVFSFELPVGGAPGLPDLNSVYVTDIQHTYNVQVMIRNRPKLHAHMVAVKGVQWEVRDTMRATTLLMEYMCGPLAKETKVHMSLEISAMHHGAVAGAGGEQVKGIMQATGTQIMFPDVADPNLPPIRKSCVTIAGRIEDVYAARQQLLGSLPVILMFDCAEEACAGAPEPVMRARNVYIALRRKPRQGIVSVLIKGVERSVGDIYEARRDLLGGKEVSVTAEIPESYSIPPLPNNPTKYGFNPFSPSHANTTNSPCSPFMHLLDISNYSAMGSPMYNQPPTPGGYPLPHSPVHVAPPWTPQHCANQFVFPAPAQASPNCWNPLTNGVEIGIQSIVAPTQFVPPTDCRPQGGLNTSSQGSSGYHSNFTGSTASLDTHNISGGDTGNAGSPSASPVRAADGSPTVDRANQELASIISEVPLCERRAVGCEKKTLELSRLPSAAARQEANRAIEQSSGVVYRVPTSRWAGHMLSATSPANIQLQPRQHSPEKPWSRADAAPVVVETKPSPPASHPAPPSPYKQLSDLMQDTGLQKYIDLFREHEVDLGTFLSLSEADLLQLGVSAFGARRKMLLLINELKNGAKNVVEACGSPNATRKLIPSPPQYDPAGFQKSHKW